MMVPITLSLLDCLEEASDTGLNALSFGVVGMSEDGTVVSY
jgi:hypothetical protein